MLCVRACDIVSHAVLTNDRESALQWQATRSAEGVNEAREAIMQQLESAGVQMWSKAVCQSWLSSAHEDVRFISKAVNGPKLKDLGRAVLHNDVGCIELFRNGAH